MKWISVDEMKPLNGERVIVAWGEGHFVGEGYYNYNTSKWMRYPNLIGAIENVVAWMPMPKYEGVQHES